MFYHLFYPLMHDFILFNVFRYVTFRSMAAFITALLFTFFIGPKIIRILRNTQAVETINDVVPESHKKKQGTPTMGGLIILSGILLSSLLWNNLFNIHILLLLLSLLWLGGLGFLDDYLKNIKKEKDGLIARYKLLGQCAISLVIAFSLYFSTNSHEITTVSIPFFKNLYFQLSWFYIPFVVFCDYGYI